MRQFFANVEKKPINQEHLRARVLFADRAFPVLSEGTSP